jgi:hypothetical protein
LTDKLARLPGLERIYVADSHDKNCCGYGSREVTKHKKAIRYADSKAIQGGEKVGGEESSVCKFVQVNLFAWIYTENEMPGIFPNMISKG